MIEIVMIPTDLIVVDAARACLRYGLSSDLPGGVTRATGVGTQQYGRRGCSDDTRRDGERRHLHHPRSVRWCFE